MDDQIKKILEQRADTYARAAEQVVPSTVGTAALDLLANGRDCDRTSLVEWFDEAISGLQKSDLKRQMYEAAREKLLAVSRSSSSR